MKQSVTETPENKAHEIMDKFIGLCSPRRYEDYGRELHVNKAKEAAIFMVNQLVEVCMSDERGNSPMDKEYWAKVMWFIVSGK